MRSLAVKLTLGFLAVGITGALLVAVINIQRTRLEFARFISQREDNDAVADLLLGYYVEAGSWEGIQQWLESDPSLDFLGRRILLADSGETVIYSALPGQNGRSVNELETTRGIPILHEDQLVGTLYDRGAFKTARSRAPLFAGKLFPAQRKPGVRARGRGCGVAGARSGHTPVAGLDPPPARANRGHG